MFTKLSEKEVKVTETIENTLSKEFIEKMISAHEAELNRYKELRKVFD